MNASLVLSKFIVLPLLYFNIPIHIIYFRQIKSKPFLDLLF